MDPRDDLTAVPFTFHALIVAGSRMLETKCQQCLGCINMQPRHLPEEPIREVGDKPYMRIQGTRASLKGIYASTVFRCSETVFLLAIAHVQTIIIAFIINVLHHPLDRIRKYIEPRWEIGVSDKEGTNVPLQLHTSG